MASNSSKENAESFLEAAAAVVPLTWCPHLADSVHVQHERFERLDFESTLCRDCDAKGENWLCLGCGEFRCSRYVKEHAVLHGLHSNEPHPLAVSLADLSCWCYVCDDYVDAPEVYDIRNALHKAKFNGEEMPKRTDYGRIVLEMK